MKNRNLFAIRYFKKQLLLAFLLIIGLERSNAQDLHFSQFYAAPIYLNPAFAGTAGGPRFILNYRNQWPGIDNAYKNLAFSYDQFMPALNGGIGVMVTNDRQADGVFNNTRIAAAYSYQLKVNNDLTIKPGIYTAYGSNAVNTSGAIWNFVNGVPNTNPNDPNITGNNSGNYIDFGAGALFFTDRYYGGVAVDHLTEPNQSTVGGNSPLPRKYTGHVGAFIPVGKKQYNASISPNILFQQQGSFSQFNVGMYYNRGPVVLGGWYRTSLQNGDAFIGLVGIKYEIYKFGYSYDIVTSSLRASASGAHEFSLSIELPQPGKRGRARSYKRVNCPSF
jgi:type IX secretion system PorP/SprF family membrane protein